jgi:hypothetical protein
MTAEWKFFRTVCFLQLLLAVFFAVTSFITVFEDGSLYYVLSTSMYVLMIWLAIIGLNLINNNYPDRPVAGKQKTVFNWIYLVNFLLLAFLFGLVFAEYRQLKALATLVGRPVLRLPFRIVTSLYLSLLLLAFQLIILYGLYFLRRLLYENFFNNKQFEFEND